MINYDANDQNSIAKFIQDNVPKHTQFALATTDANGKPWVVCVNLAVDEQFNFIWKSQKTTEHSQNILERPDVAICVFSMTDDVGDFGYYCNATAHEVTDREELQRLLEIRCKSSGKPVPPLDDFLGESSVRLYFAKVTQAWVNDDRHAKTAVDLRCLSVA